MALTQVTTGMLADSSVTPAKLSQPLTAGTAVASTSGTSIDFTSIPSWVKRITVMLSAVSTNGSSPLTLRLGTSSGIVSSGYTGSAFFSGTTGQYNIDTTGFPLGVTSFSGASYAYQGAAVLTLLGSNIWTCTGSLYLSVVTDSIWLAGSMTALGGTLDRVRITTLNGTDTFDAGSINILYE